MMIDALLRSRRIISSSSLFDFQAEWEQIIQVKGNSVSVRKEIACLSDCSVVEMFAAFGEQFYQVRGSSLVEEIAYTVESGCIQGTERKQGTVVLHQVVSLLDPDTLSLALTIFVGGKDLPLGTAVFRRA